MGPWGTPQVIVFELSMLWHLQTGRFSQGWTWTKSPNYIVSICRGQWHSFKCRSFLKLPFDWWIDVARHCTTMELVWISDIQDHIKHHSIDHRYHIYPFQCTPFPLQSRLESLELSMLRCFWTRPFSQSRPWTKSPDNIVSVCHGFSSTHPNAVSKCITSVTMSDRSLDT